MSPQVRARLWAGFHEAARREPPGTRRARFKALSGLLGYGAGMRTLERTLHRLTSP